MPQLSLTERIAESFTLARAERAAEATPESVRRGVAEDLALSRQKADAAESLFDNGHPAEAIKLAHESLEQAIVAVAWLGHAPDSKTLETPKAKPNAPADESKAAAASTDEADTSAATEPAKASEEAAEPSEEAAKASEEAAKASEEAAKASEEAAKASEEAAKAAEASTGPSPSGVSAASWRQLLSRRGAADEVLAAIETVLTASRSQTAPRLDGEVTPEHATAFHRVLAARVAIDREIHPSAMTAAQVRGKRRNRIALTTFVVIAVVLGAYFALRRPSGTFATASASFNNADEYAPANVIDGRVESEWLLPDRSAGWVEINVDPPRRIEAVNVINASNQPHEDRASREYTVEVWAHGELARSVEGNLPFSTARNPVRTEVGVDDVERVRVLVRSWHQNGGGLAEISFE
ncbi:MAG: hypothetical protein J0L92_02510 [Deltaproteobacteria bacterium]|nr:hypothetical protein [Deltaproteobacteria bacterium]